ncbi:MAG: transcriptional regulator [Bacillota bacterium]
MGDSKFQKIRLLKVYEILKKYSDESNPLSTQDIMDKLMLEGVYATRKTIYNDIAELKEFGYEIATSRSRSNKYYVIERSFDLTEIKILIDAVNSSRFLTANRSEQLLNKLSTLESETQSKMLLQNCVSLGRKQTTNKAVYYSINTIDVAITNKKQISFLYTEYNEKGEKVLRKEGKRYVISPITMFIESGRYYVACWEHKYNDLSLYRVDRMCDIIELKDDAILPLDTQELSKIKEKMFEVHNGKEVLCEFIVAKNMVDVIIDEIGKDVKFIKIDEKCLKFSAKILVSRAFIGWVIKFGKYVRVVSPPEVVKEVQELLLELNKIYL